MKKPFGSHEALSSHSNHGNNQAFGRGKAAAPTSSSPFCFPKELCLLGSSFHGLTAIHLTNVFHFQLCARLQSWGYLSRELGRAGDFTNLGIDLDAGRRHKIPGPGTKDSYNIAGSRNISLFTLVPLAPSSHRDKLASFRNKNIRHPVEFEFQMSTNVAWDIHILKKNDSWFIWSFSWVFWFLTGNFAQR